MKLASSGYKHDLRLERKFSATLKSILGNQFIVQDPVEDRVGGTDFVVWGLQTVRVATRLRTWQCYEKWPNQFTLRWSRPSGLPTEIHKVQKGLVDYLLYGFVDAQEERIVSYFIGNLQVFRHCNIKPLSIRENDPPDSQLAIWNLDQFPADFIMKRWTR